MKNSTLKFCLITILLITVISVSAQTKSTLLIKSMTIQNGDTIVKEQSIQNEGKPLIYDSLFDNNSLFLFFNKDYELDTNLSDNFSKSFGHEMENFLKEFNFPSENLFGQDFDLGFPSNIDSMFSHAYPPDIFKNNPDSENSESPKAKVWYPYSISCENMVSILNPSLDNYSAEPDPLKGIVKITFSLDEQKPTAICITDSKNKIVYKEKLPKSKGIYVRLFDFSVYEPGDYYINITQGKKQNKSLLIFSKNF
jgi:hypothetical protein